MKGRERIQGVFSAKTLSYIGTGTTKRRTENTTYWYAEELENGVLEVQAINEQYLPSGPRVAVEIEAFLNKYRPEPEMFSEKVIPGMHKLEQSIILGERHRRNRELYSAEHEFEKAISLDEVNVRANFGLGLTYLDRGDISMADDIFRRLVCIEASYEQQHKHLFNEFGISLRKHGMHEQALEYYHKAEKLVEEDENLCLNIARVHYEMGRLDDCIAYLKKALCLNEKLEEACIFLDFLHGKGFVEACTIENLLSQKCTT
ncbi:tetratricopeptide repeat protein [Maridesulfovibrio sp. FT414]|uniref:tetratricopeptide repeat protein n=1 Tax=Maridesulfovibrio sp. FT414 TaxID=2979469 RepID=UPI003D808DD5